MHVFQRYLFNLLQLQRALYSVVLIDHKNRCNDIFYLKTFFDISTGHGRLETLILSERKFGKAEPEHLIS